MSVPIIHARSRIAVTFTAAPPIESSTVPRLRRTLDRSSAPAPEAISIPVTAVPKMTRMVNTARGAGLRANAPATPGAKYRPASAPPMKPPKLRIPMMKPWRYPATAKAAARTSSTTSSMSPGTVHHGIPPCRRRLPIPGGRPRMASARSGAGQRDPAGRLADRGGVPGQLPPAEGQQPVEQERGEPPDQHRPGAERRARLPRGVPDHHPVRGVGEVGQRHPGDRGHLGRVARRDRAWLPPPGEDGRDPVPAPGDVHLGQHGEDLDPGGVDERLLGRLAQ